jgi:hypothetical protein
MDKKGGLLAAFCDIIGFLFLPTQNITFGDGLASFEGRGDKFLSGKKQA